MQKKGWLLPVLFLTACASPVALLKPPGTTEQVGAKDHYECQREAFHILPPQRGEVPQYVVPPPEPVGGSLSYDFFGGLREGFNKGYAQRDLNQGARQDYYFACMSARGYMVTTQKEADEIRGKQKRECEAQGGVWRSYDVTCGGEVK